MKFEVEHVRCKKLYVTLQITKQIASLTIVHIKQKLNQIGTNTYS